MRFFLVLLLAAVVFGYPRNESKQGAPSADDSDDDMLMEPLDHEAITEKEPEANSQNFYPSFSPFNAPPLGHSRPFFYQQEGAYSQRSAPFQQQLSYDSYRGENYNPPSAGHGLLGSGNFGVLKGGTFYSDNDGDSTSDYSETYNPYYHNGHGRPSFSSGAAQNPRPQQHDQFANFRDFADINTPSYSQFVVVYANKNGSQHKHGKEPKNIIETLAMLDMEGSSTTETPVTKKLSKAKRKLAQVLPEKKIKMKRQGVKTTTVPPKDLYEPLLALS